jgi:hypothetical protein
VELCPIFEAESSSGKFPAEMKFCSIGPSSPARSGRSCPTRARFRFATSTDPDASTAAAWRRRLARAKSDGESKQQGLPDVSARNIPKRGKCQVCQVVCFQTKNPSLGKFWSALEWKMLLCFMIIWNILWQSG